MKYSFERISAAFIVKHVRFMSWECLKLAFDRGWITVGTVVIIADSRVTSELEGGELLAAVQLANLDSMKWDTAKRLLSELCRLERTKGNHDSQQKCWKLWLLIGLRWLYENTS